MKAYIEIDLPESCHDYNSFEKKLFELGTLNHNYFLPRLEALKDAVERNII